MCMFICLLDVSVSELPLSREQLIKEIDCLHDVLPKLGSPVVFSHNDFLLQNIIYDEKARQYFIVNIIGTVIRFLWSPEL